MGKEEGKVISCKKCGGKMILVGGGEIFTKLRCLACGWNIEIRMPVSQFIRECKKEQRQY